jgi:hypothetical protein
MNVAKIGLLGLQPGADVLPVTEEVHAESVDSNASRRNSSDRIQSADLNVQFRLSIPGVHPRVTFGRTVMMSVTRLCAPELTRIRSR